MVKTIYILAGMSHVEGRKTFIVNLLCPCGVMFFDILSERLRDLPRFTGWEGRYHLKSGPK